MSYWFLTSQQALVWHATFEFTAYVISLQYYSYLQKYTHDKLTTHQRTIIFIAAIIGALLGSRGLAYLENLLSGQATDPLWYLFANKTIVGGLLGALIVIEITKKIYRIRYSSGDLLTYPLLLGLCIGRIGCFGASLIDNTYGTATTMPWGIDFGDGIYRHPTNLYEILFLLTLWVILFFLHTFTQKYDGLRFKLFLSSYLLFRFLVDFLKPYPVWSWHLSIIQFACLLGIIYYLIAIPLCIRKKQYA